MTIHTYQNTIMASGIKHAFDLRMSGLSLESVYENPESINRVCGDITAKKVGDYVVLKYKKDVFKSHDVMHSDYANKVGNFRSVLLYMGGKVVSVAPPKSSNIIQHQDRCYIEELVEGTMVTFFHNGLTWDMTTRSNPGGNNNFYLNGKSFREMTYEALDAQGVSVEQFNPELCYVFTLRHPNNRIVLPVTEPVLSLVTVYKIDGLDVYELSLRYNEEIRKFIIDTKFHTPILYEENPSPEKFHEIVRRTTTLCPYSVEGLVIRYSNGLRIKKRTNAYQYVKQLRGNQAKVQFQYYVLRRQNRLGEYLQYFPEETFTFQEFDVEFHNFVNMVHGLYMNIFVKKVASINDITQNSLKRHLHDLHGQYMTSLRYYKKMVTTNVVYYYFACMDPALLMHSINYMKRQEHISV